jgi:hypothetical protein
MTPRDILRMLFGGSVSDGAPSGPGIDPDRALGNLPP